MHFLIYMSYATEKGQHDMISSGSMLADESRWKWHTPSYDKMCVQTYFGQSITLCTCVLSSSCQWEDSISEHCKTWGC